MLSLRGWVSAARGDYAGARADAADALRHVDGSTDAQVRSSVGGMSACALALCGDFEQSTSIVDDLLQGDPDLFRSGGTAAVDAVVAADLAGDAGRVVEVVGSLPSPWGSIAVDVGAGRYAEAADRLQETGELRLTALVRLRAAEELIATGRAGDAHGHAAAAAEFFGSVGATALLRRASELMPATA
jgi:hypothetical protein